MGYTGDYSLGARCLSECLGTMTYVFFIGCLLANKLLPKTKAHDLTYGWVAFGVGIAAFVPVQFLGFISGIFNPATTLGAAIVGSIDWLDFPYLVLSQTLGAFIGSVAMWIFYLPQFETDPEPPPTAEQDRLLRTHNDMGSAALDYVAYNTSLEPRRSVSGAGLREFGRLMSNVGRSSAPQRRSYRVIDLLGRDAVGELGTERHHSVTVPSMQRRMARLEKIPTPVRRTHRSYSANACDTQSPDESVIDVDMFQTSRDQESVQTQCMEKEMYPVKEESSKIQFGCATDSGNLNDSAICEVSSETTKAEEEIETISKNDVDPKLIASYVADQNMKLAIFCTRPARYLPISNLLTEIISTFYLVVGIMFLKERAEFMYEGYDDIYKHCFIAFFVALFVFLIILCFGIRRVIGHLALLIGFYQFLEKVNLNGTMHGSL